MAGSNPELVVRVAANLAELKANLAEGRSQIETTTGAMGKLAASFSGDKIIQSAHNVVAAVNEIGGAAKLTEAEQARVNATVEKALEKYRVLGKEAPAGMQALADATKQTDGALSGMLGRVGEMAAGFLTAEAAIHLVEAGFHLLVSAGEHLWTTALNGAGVADVEENFKHLAAEAGLLADTLMGELRTGTHNTVTDFELMKVANQNMTAGLDLTDQQFGTLAKGAFALAQATGGDVKTALDTMSDAMVTGRTKALALLTGKIDVETAEKKYAATLGVSRENLTEAGKMESARVAILDSVGAATERLGEQTDGLDERVAQAQVAWTNFEEDLGKTVATSAVLEAGMSGLKQALIETFGGSQEALIKLIAQRVDDVAIAVVGLAEQGVTSAGFLVKEWYAVKKIYGDIAQIVEGDAVAFEYLAKGIAVVGELLHLPGAAENVKRLDDNIQALMERMVARGKALQEDDRLQANVDKTTAGYVATLEGLRVKMEAARTSSSAFVGPLQAVTGAEAGASEAARKHAEALTTLGPAQEAAAKKFAEAVTEVEAAGQGWKGTIDTIDGAVLENMRTLTAAGVSLQAIVTYYGLAATQGAAFTLMLKDETEQLKLEAKSVEAITKLWADYTDLVQREGTSAYAQAGAAADKWAADTIAAAERAGTATQQLYDAVAKIQVEEWRQAGIDMGAINTSLQTQTQQGLQETADQAQRTYQEALQYLGVMAAGDIEKYRAIADAAQLAASAFGTGFEVNAAKANAAIDTTTAKMKAAHDQQASYSLAGGNVPSGKRGVLTHEQLLNAGYIYPNGDVTPLGEAMGYGHAAGARAEGGPVIAGSSYLVGEKGPELFVPSQSGSIVPHGAGGGVTQHITVQVTHPLGTPQAIASAVGAAHLQAQRNLGLRFPTAV